MKIPQLMATGAIALALPLSAAAAETITVATVNNADMIIMQKLSPKWEEQTGNKINWVVLEENVLRQRVTTDIATKGGQFDIVTIGAYEAPIWGSLGWLTPLDDLPNYDYDDVFQSVRNGLSSDGKLYAVPFYAESQLTFYRKDLFDASRGLEDAGAADLRRYQDLCRQADRQEQRAVRRLFPRQAWLGRERRHADPDG